MSGETVYVSVGSNINPAVHIPKAIQALEACSDIENLCVSAFYINEALGRPEQPYYRNGVARFTTFLEPDMLKADILRPIEHDCGRVRETDRYAPRTLDLDIVLFGDRVIADDRMTIPDPAIWEHVFVTIPLLQIEPELIVPGRDTALVELVPMLDPAALPIDDSLNYVIHEGKDNG